MGEGPRVLEGGGEGAVEGSGEGGGVARLLVEEEDAGGCCGVGGCGGDLGGEPGGGELDALERVAAVDVPGYVFLAAGFAAAGPVDLFETADEFGGEEG